MYLSTEPKWRSATDRLVHAEAVDRSALFDETEDSILVHAVRYEDVNMLKPLRIQLGAYFLYQTGCDAATFHGGAEVHAAQPVTECARDIDRLLCLVLECVKYRNSGDFERQVTVVGLKRLYRIAEQERKSVLHISGRRNAGKSSAEHRGNRDAAANDCRVVYERNDIGMGVCRHGANHRNAARRIDAFTGGGCPAAGRRKHTADRHFI